MTSAPSAVSPELKLAVRDLLFEAVFNDWNPAEHSTTLAGVKEHGLLGEQQHLLEGVSVRDFHALVTHCLDEEITRLVDAYGRIQELRAAAARTHRGD